MKKFILLWIGEMISNIGSGMTAFALSLYIYNFTGKVSDIAMLSLISFLPAILINPIGGILADRYDRRVLMIMGDVLSGLCLLYILYIIRSSDSMSDTIVPIFIAIGVSSIFLGILEPAYKSTVTELISSDNYDKASGLLQLAASSKLLISPALAGIILAKSNIDLILIIDISTVLFTIIILTIIRNSLKNDENTIEENIDKTTTEKNIIKELRDGLEIIRGNKGVSNLVFLMFLACFLMAFIQVLVRPMILIIANEKMLGIAESICAFGILVGSGFIGIRGIKLRYARSLGIGGIISGIFISLAGFSSSLIFIVIFIFVFFITLPFINASADALVRNSIPNSLQGRAWGIIGFLTQIGIVAAFLISGPIVDNVFEPMMREDGILSNTFLRIIGVGPGRGIGLLLIIVGILFSIVFAFTLNNKNINQMEEKDGI
ncbi:MFS transporter [Anaerococcus sp. ENR0831]|uniref:MFS transporter n=1 Tax=Anaerococcus martiniensis TaxID=3115615 RepID=A0ABW9MA94_9FIRM